MVEQTIIVPARVQLDVYFSQEGYSQIYYYQIQQKKARRLFWRREWHFEKGHVYRPGPLPRTDVFNSLDNEGHTFKAEPKPFKLWFRVWGLSSNPVFGCVSNDHGLVFTGARGEKVCEFHFRWSGPGVRTQVPNIDDLWR